MNTSSIFLWQKLIVIQFTLVSIVGNMKYLYLHYSNTVLYRCIPTYSTRKYSNTSSCTRLDLPHRDTYKIDTVLQNRSGQSHRFISNQNPDSMTIYDTVVLPVYEFLIWKYHTGIFTLIWQTTALDLDIELNSDKYWYIYILTLTWAYSISKCIYIHIYLHMCVHVYIIHIPV